MRPALCVFALAAVLLAACSKQPSSTSASARNAPATAAAAPAGSACDRKLLAAEDVVGILGAAPTVTKNIPGDPQSCKFETSGFPSLTVSVRPGHGVAAVGMYTSGKMTEFEASKPLSGVGTEAVRSLSLNRVIARKDDLLCEITGPGLADANDESKARQLGALCNKIFAAY